VHDVPDLLEGKPNVPSFITFKREQWVADLEERLERLSLTLVSIPDVDVHLELPACDRNDTPTPLIAGKHPCLYQDFSQCVGLVVQAD
jgi:hypothetical protein